MAPFSFLLLLFNADLRNGVHTTFFFNSFIYTGRAGHCIAWEQNKERHLERWRLDRLAMNIDECQIRNICVFSLGTIQRGVRLHRRLGVILGVFRRGNSERLGVWSFFCIDQALSVFRPFMASHLVIYEMIHGS